MSGLRAEAENRMPVETLRQEGHMSPDRAPLLDRSPRMRAIGTVIENIADTDATVLLRGESGVGKDLVARAIHAPSSRRQGPFVKVNCAAIPQGLLESELFGHEKGAFTGAHRRKPGQFEYANKGTLYLDEIAELPLALQAKLLHVLQDFQFARVGGHGLLDVDTRVIAATNRNLEEEMARGEFREDLYYRLNVVEIRVPPLRGLAHPQGQLQDAPQQDPRVRADAAFPSGFPGFDPVLIGLVGRRKSPSAAAHRCPPPARQTSA